MATIVKTASGTWKALIRKQGWPSTAKTFRTKRDAEDWSRRTEDEMVRGVYIQRGASERLTFDAALDRYLIEVTERAQMSSIEITVSPWIASAIRERAVLTLSSDYFLLRSSFARRIYELARKHCGNQLNWSIGLARLHEKSGSRATVRECRRQLAELMRAGTIPDYDFDIDKERELVRFWRRSARASIAAISRLFTDKDAHHQLGRPRRAACGAIGG